MGNPSEQRGALACRLAPGGAHHARGWPRAGGALTHLRGAPNRLTAPALIASRGHERGQEREPRAGPNPNMAAY